MEARKKHPFKDAEVLLLRKEWSRNNTLKESRVFAGWRWPQYYEPFDAVINLSKGHFLETIGLDGVTGEPL
jgi:hypothetical protein